jgi:hypothetical protein
VSSTERVRKWRAEQRRKAQLYDQLEAARRAHLERQAAHGEWPGGMIEDHAHWRRRWLERGLNDPLCFDIFAVPHKA